ncbi:hypothetical protein SAMN05444380_1131, partial [Thermophagus xiamenensis]
FLDIQFFRYLTTDLAYYLVVFYILAFLKKGLAKKLIIDISIELLYQPFI